MRAALAFLLGEMNSHKEQMVFDWEKAAKLIRKHKPQRASAGLRADWEYTGGSIWEDEKPVNRENAYTYLASTWAVPELEINGEVIECYKMASETPGWDAYTYWPQEALNILQGDI